MRRGRRVKPFAVVLALLAAVAVAAAETGRRSAWTTVDEPVHLAAARELADGRGVVSNFEHPVLMKLVSAAGLASRPPGLVVEETRDGRRLFPWLLGLLVLGVGLWTRRLAGPVAGAGAAVLVLSTRPFGGTRRSSRAISSWPSASSGPASSSMLQPGAGASTCGSRPPAARPTAWHSSRSTRRSRSSPCSWPLPPSGSPERGVPGRLPQGSAGREQVCRPAFGRSPPSRPRPFSGRPRSPWPFSSRRPPSTARRGRGSAPASPGASCPWPGRSRPARRSTGPRAPRRASRRTSPASPTSARPPRRAPATTTSWARFRERATRSTSSPRSS